MAKSFNDLPSPAQAGILIAVPVLAAALVFAGIPGVMDGYVLPLHAKQDALHKQYLKLKADNDQDEAFRRQKTEYENRIRQAQAQLETRRLLVPNEPDTDEFMRNVFDAGMSTRINVRTFLPQPQVTRDFYVEMPFKVRLDGTYYDVLGFFDALAKQTRIISVAGLSLGTPEGGGMGSYTVRPSETVGADCVITTYYNRATPPPAPPIKK
jgi:type IV pilus assembly protein PilO